MNFSTKHEIQSKLSIGIMNRPGFLYAPCVPNENINVIASQWIISIFWCCRTKLSERLWNLLITFVLENCFYYQMEELIKCSCKSHDAILTFRFLDAGLANLCVPDGLVYSTIKICKIGVIKCFDGQHPIKPRSSRLEIGPFWHLLMMIFRREKYK